MKIERLILGELDTNCYLLRKNNKVIVIDPADNKEEIINKIGKDKLVGIIITHHHFDHIGAMNELQKHYNVEIYDRNNLNQGINKIDDFIFEVIYTPGHTDDSITIYFEKEKIMFVGDFIFKNSIGRTDLGGNITDMKKSISLMKKYRDITIYPGHGEETNIDYEIKYNYYFNNL